MKKLIAFVALGSSALTLFAVWSLGWAPTPAKVQLEPLGFEPNQQRHRRFGEHQRDPVLAYIQRTSPRYPHLPLHIEPGYLEDSGIHGIAPMSSEFIWRGRAHWQIVVSNTPICKVWVGLELSTGTNHPTRS